MMLQIGLTDGKPELRFKADEPLFSPLLLKAIVLSLGVHLILFLSFRIISMHEENYLLLYPGQVESDIGFASGEDLMIGSASLLYHPLKRITAMRPSIQDNLPTLKGESVMLSNIDDLPSFVQIEERLSLDSVEATPLQETILVRLYGEIATLTIKDECKERMVAYLQKQALPFVATCFEIQVETKSGQIFAFDGGLEEFQELLSFVSFKRENRSGVLCGRLELSLSESDLAAVLVESMP